MNAHTRPDPYGPKRDVMGEIIADMECHAADTLDRLMDAAADRMANEPWRIGQAVYDKPIWPVEKPGRGEWIKPTPGGNAIWHSTPPRTLTVADVLADCRRLIEGESKRNAAGHWTSPTSSRLVAFRQAEAALCRMAHRAAARPTTPEGS